MYICIHIYTYLYTSTYKRVNNETCNVLSSRIEPFRGLCISARPASHLPARLPCDSCSRWRHLNRFCVRRGSNPKRASIPPNNGLTPKMRARWDIVFLNLQSIQSIGGHPQDRLGVVIAPKQGYMYIYTSMYRIPFKCT